MKPDVGERGVGVRWAQGPADLEAYLAREAGARSCVQQAHDGPFESRPVLRPPPGRAARPSLLDHRQALPGRRRRRPRHASTELIARHPRYRLQAAVFLARLADARSRAGGGRARSASDAPATIARAPSSATAATLRHPALEAAVERDRAAHRRLPLRPLRRALRVARRRSARGEGFAIVELNGVTSEATHIYDPDASLVAAWRTPTPST